MPSASRSAVLTGADTVRAGRRSAARGRKRCLPGARKLHTWAGLGAGLWLAVLGITGFVLDHRDWAWLWQSTAPEFLVPGQIVAKARSGTVRLYQLNPDQPQQHVAGGPQGLWISNDGGQRWQSVVFNTATVMPGVNVILRFPGMPRSGFWLGTSDGVWELDTVTGMAQRVALPGARITALAAGASDTGLLGVMDRSRVFRLDLAHDSPPAWIDLAAPAPGELPESIALSRLVHDLHFGRGLLAAPLSLLINDAGAWLMLLLPVGGFLFWWLPRRWRSGARCEKPRAATRKRTVQWIYRLHGPALGLVAVIPFLYLTLTGILLDHAPELRPWMKSIHIPQALQPPVYRLRSWDNEIHAIAGYPGVAEKFSLGTRLGLFTTQDEGKNWTRETGRPLDPGFVWTLRRHGNDLLIGGMGGPNLQRHGDSGWRPVQGTGHMPTDISHDGNGGYLWLNREGFHPELSATRVLSARHSLPGRGGVPWYFIIDGLHSGMLIHAQWKWVNDIVALACLLLAVTGLMRWWRQRWI
ncbi:MAG: PepSY domain-containing protein [Thiogranum sp.]